MKVNNQKPAEYCKMPKEDVLHVFQRYGVTFPRAYRISSLKKVLEKILQRQYNVLLNKARTGDNMVIQDAYRMGRLKWYTYLSETQMEIELDLLADEDLNIKYYKTLWAHMIEHIMSLTDAKQIINDLNLLDAKKSKFYAPKVFDYNRFLDKLFNDEEFHLDGVHVNEFRKYVYQTSSIDELKIIANKYAVSIPTSFNKEALKDRLIQGLSEKGVYQSEVVTTIDKATVKELKALLEQNGLNNRTYLNKEEVIEFILEHSNQVKHLYVKPTGDFTYGLNINEEPKTRYVDLINEVSHQSVMTANISTDQITLRLDRIIMQQNQLIEIFRKDATQSKEEKKKSLLDKIYNYVIFTLIIIVASIWIIYGFSTLLG